MFTYESLRDFAAVWGSLYFGAMFIVAIAYALWPANKERFDEAARLPCRED
jgi:cytochrome c oxidase cbb3-type subunit IV